jgi:predicted metal-binding membrane protein
MTTAHAKAIWRTQRLRNVDRDLVVLVVLLVAAAGWAALVATHGGEHLAAGHTTTPELAPTEPHTMHSGPATGGPALPAPLVATALAVGAWTIMVLAMMLPPALPLLQTVRQLTSRQPDPWRLTTLSAMTFVGAWTVVGATVVIGDLGVRLLTERNWPDADPRWLTAGALVLAGVYQFSPLKDLCLRGCRSPRSFVLTHWQGRRSTGAETITLSGAYALSCIGCCWALMLICFAVGTAALPVMVALSLLMAAERLVSWGRRLVRPSGLVLIVLGAATAPAAAAPPIPLL